MANSTASQILTLSWNLLGEDGSTVSNPALQQATMLAVLHDANSEWLRVYKRGAGEPPLFMKKETAFDLVAQTDLNGAITTASTTIDLTSASDFATSGAIVVYDDDMPDVIEYTGKSSNQLTGVTGIDWAHEDADQVIRLYALPSNFSSIRATHDTTDGVQVEGASYVYVPDDPEGSEYSIYDNGTTKYLWLPRGLTGSCRVTYNKTSTTIDDLADVVDVPKEYEWFLIHRLVEHGRRSRGDNSDKVIESQQKANTIIREAQAEKNTTKIVRTRPIGVKNGMSKDEYYRLSTRD